MLHSRNLSPSRRYSTSPQQIGNSDTDKQRSDNSGFDAETNKTKAARPWFHKPLCSKKELKRIRKEFKEVFSYKQKSEPKSKKRCFGCTCLTIHPGVLLTHGSVGLICGNRNKMDFSVYVTSFLIGFVYLLRYLDDVDKLFSSIFEIGDKSITAYCADIVFIELFLNGVRVAGLVCQFLNGRQHVLIFIIEIAVVILHFTGNVLLIGEKGLPDSRVDDSAPASNSHDPIELQSYNQTTE